MSRWTNFRDDVADMAKMHPVKTATVFGLGFGLGFFAHVVLAWVS